MKLFDWFRGNNVLEIYTVTKDAVEFRKPRMRYQPFFRWYDLWVGVFIDTKCRIVYVCPLPMIGLKIYWG